MEIVYVFFLLNISFVVECFMGDAMQFVKMKKKEATMSTYCTYIIAFSVIAKVWLLVAVATARKLLVCAKGGNFRI